MGRPSSVNWIVFSAGSKVTPTTWPGLWRTHGYDAVLGENRPIVAMVAPGSLLPPASGAQLAPVLDEADGDGAGARGLRQSVFDSVWPHALGGGKPLLISCTFQNLYFEIEDALVHGYAMVRAHRAGHHHGFSNAAVYD